MREVYLILSCPDSIPSGFIRIFTREPFSHISITFDETLSEFYSFGRKSRYNFLNGGFVFEGIGKGILGRGNVSCRVCRLKLTQEQYEKMQSLLNHFIENANHYKYNFSGFFGSIVHWYPKYEDKMFCSQFVAYLLEMSGVKILDKEYVQVRPKDFRLCDKMEIIYEGYLNDYPYQKAKPLAM